MTYVQNAQQTHNIKKAFGNLPKFKAAAKAKSPGVFWLEPEEGDSLKRGKIGAEKGRPAGSRLFTLVGEFLHRDTIDDLPDGMTGIYVLFDSSATARYVGLSGNLKARLKQHMNGKTKADKEKQAFTERYSVFALSDGSHARELESVLVRAIGSSLINGSKNRNLLDVTPNLKIFEPGTLVLANRK
jgi:predicted GIY-YIG superfamily endonuclease